MHQRQDASDVLDLDERYPFVDEWPRLGGTASPFPAHILDDGEVGARCCQVRFARSSKSAEIHRCFPGCGRVPACHDVWLRISRRRAPQTGEWSYHFILRSRRFRQMLRITQVTAIQPVSAVASIFPAMRARFSAHVEVKRLHSEAFRLRLVRSMLRLRCSVAVRWAFDCVRLVHTAFAVFARDSLPEGAPYASRTP